MITAIALLLAAQQPSSQPAGPASGSPADVVAEVTFLFEIGEKSLGATENWNLGSQGKTIAATALAFEIHDGAKKVKVDDKSGFHVEEGTLRLTSNQPLTDDRPISISYETPFSGSKIVLRRTLPFNMSRARVVFEDLPGFRLETVPESVKRTRDLNGIKFAIWDFPSMPPGTQLELIATGLPSKPVWPKFLAVFAALAIAAWAVWALINHRAPGADAALAIGPLSGRARRDRLVKAIELLKRDFEASQLNEKQYARRHEALMQELAVVLREIEIEERGARTASGAR